MKFKQYKDIKSFYNDTFDILMRHEAQNIVLLGNIIMGNEGKDTFGWRDTSKWFMAVVSDETGVRLTAVITPPLNLCLYATDNQINDEAIKYLIDGINDAGITFPMVMTEEKLAERFAEIYSKSNDLKPVVFKKIRMYEISKLKYKKYSLCTLRLAEKKDIAFLPYWIEGFNNKWYDASQIALTDIERYYYEIASNKIYIMEDEGVPVAMAKITRETKTFFCIGMAYCPPFFQENGFVISCIDLILRENLEKGLKKCVVMTDLENWTIQLMNEWNDNTHICDCLEIKFE